MPQEIELCAADHEIERLVARLGELDNSTLNYLMRLVYEVYGMSLSEYLSK